MFLMAVFVWPTQYRYDHVISPYTKVQTLVRIDRLTGQTQYLTSRYGWSTSAYDH
jgi:hypothetical protein